MPASSEPQQMAADKLSAVTGGISMPTLQRLTKISYPTL
jgi:hypothetical protein